MASEWYVSDVLQQTSSMSSSYQGSCGYGSQSSSISSSYLRSSYYGSQTRQASYRIGKLLPALRWTSTPPEPTPTIVTPELSSQSPEKYRLQCPHAGVFQCSLTGLGFQMEGEGEVLYSIVQWDEDLLASTGQTPAGPLFSIDCPRGSVCQLHLPHCEMVPGEGLGSLSVAHVSDDSVELLQPLRVTDTHVVVNITDLSSWGLLRWKVPFITIRGQVLPFLESRRSRHSLLNLVIVPANVPLTEVISFFKEIHKESSYMSASSVHCSLTRGGTYSLCCAETEKIKPEHAKIHWSYGPNYHHTFQVFLSADTEEVELKLLEKDEGEQVWAACIQLREPEASSMDSSQTEHILASSTEPEASSMDSSQTEHILASSTAPGASSLGGRQTEHAQSGSAEKRLFSARKEFAKRVSKAVLNNLLDGLLEKKVLNDSETESVKVEKEKAERARVLIDMVRGKGDQPCSMLMDLLREEDSYLHSELGFN